MLTRTVSTIKQSLFFVSLAVIVSAIGILSGLLYSRYTEDLVVHKPVIQAGYESTTSHGTIIFAVSDPYHTSLYPVL